MTQHVVEQGESVLSIANERGLVPGSIVDPNTKWSFYNRF